MQKMQRYLVNEWWPEG